MKLFNSLFAVRKYWVIDKISLLAGKQLLFFPFFQTPTHKNDLDVVKSIVMQKTISSFRFHSPLSSQKLISVSVSVSVSVFVKMFLLIVFCLLLPPSLQTLKKRRCSPNVCRGVACLSVRLSVCLSVRLFLCKIKSRLKMNKVVE
jgi:hypothetical protein